MDQGQLMKLRLAPGGRIVPVLAAVSIAMSGLIAPSAQATPASSAESAALAPIDLGSLGGYASSATAVSGSVVVGYSYLEGNRHRHAFAYDLDAPSPVMLDLGTLGGGDSIANAVSGSVVIGTADTPDGTNHAFAYDLNDPSPKMRDLGSLGGEHSNSYANAISGGVVVGGSRTATGQVHAFAYDLDAPSPMMRDLGTLGGESSSANAVSGDVVVGSSQATDGTNHAFAFDLGDPAPAMRDLGRTDEAAGARAISGDVVTGRSQSGEWIRSFVYDLGAASPAMRDLGAFGTSETKVYDADGDIVVGSSVLPDWQLGAHAFVYDTAALTPQMKDIGTVGNDKFSVASAISGDIVVGDSHTPGWVNGRPTRPFAYNLAASTPEMIELGTLGGIRGHASDVDGSVVVGNADVEVAESHATAWILPPVRTATSTTVASTVNQSVVGDQVTYTATISPVPDGGTVSFTDNDTVIADCASRPVNTVTGQAVCQVTYDTTGEHKVRARYSGDVAFGRSPSRAIPQRVVTATPSAPTGVTVLGGVGTAAVSWQPPTWPGTSAVSGYRITESPDGQTYNVDADARSVTVTNLAHGTDYSFDVRAVNGSGPGEAATTSLRGTTLSISSTTITYGSSTTVTGTLTDTAKTALDGRSVALKSRKKGTSTWSPAGTATTDSAGRYSFTVKPSYNYEYHTTYPGSSTYLGTESATGTVLVRQKVTAQWADNTVRGGQTARIYGSVAPNHRGQTIYLQRYYSGAWHTVTSTTLGSTSTYSFYRTTNTAGTYKYRTYRPADPDHASGWSPTRTLYVS